MTDQVNSQSSGNEGAAPPVSDNATAVDRVAPLAAELGPNGLPVHPPEGDPGQQVEASFILDTFFGDGQAPAPDNSGGDQGAGPKPSEAQPPKGSLAPPQAAPTANEGEGGSSQPGSSPTQQPGEQQAGAAGPAAQTPGQSQPASPEPKPATPELSAEDRLRLASADALARQNAELIERLRRFEGQPQPGAQPQGQPQPGGPTPQSGQEPAQPGAAPVEQLRLVVPDQLYDGIMSEDRATAQQSMSVLVTAVAQNAVRAALAAVPAIVDQRVSAVTQQLEQTKQVEQLEKAYFEAFPAHNNPMFRQLIQSETEETYKQFPSAPWNADMINAVGAKVNAKLTALGINPLTMANGAAPQGDGQQPANGNGSGQPQPRPKPAPMLDSSTRAGEGGVPQDAGDFIRSTFG